MESVSKSYENGAFIFHKGEVGNAAYILIEGSVEISIDEGAGKTVLSVLKPVSVFGEMSLLRNDNLRTADAKAIGPVKVAEINRTDFDNFFEESPKLISTFLRVLVNRLKEGNEKVVHGQKSEVFTAVIETLNILAINGRSRGIRHADFSAGVCRVCGADLPQVEDTIRALVKAGLIELAQHGERSLINIMSTKDFLPRAEAALQNLSE